MTTVVRFPPQYLLLLIIGSISAGFCRKRHSIGTSSEKSTFVTNSSSNREEGKKPAAPRIQRIGGATRTFHRSSGIIEFHPPHGSSRSLDAYYCRSDVLRPPESYGVGRGNIAVERRLRKHRSLLSSRLISDGLHALYRSLVFHAYDLDATIGQPSGESDTEKEECVMRGCGGEAGGDGN